MQRAGGCEPAAAAHPGTRASPQPLMGLRACRPCRRTPAGPGKRRSGGSTRQGRPVDSSSRGSALSPTAPPSLASAGRPACAAGSPACSAGGRSWQKTPTLPWAQSLPSSSCRRCSRRADQTLFLSPLEQRGQNMLLHFQSHL